MKKGKGSTFNIQHSTPKELEAVAWEFNEGAGGNRKFDLEDRLLEFASAVIDLSESLPATRAGNHVAGQVLRPGTSPYPNHGEAEAAESREDFIHKLRICLKELRETRRWARLVKRKAWVKNHAPVRAGRMRRVDSHLSLKHSNREAHSRSGSAQADSTRPLPLRQCWLIPCYPLTA